jgi:hypothetical protein
MNRCHALGHLAVIVAGLAGAVVACAAVPPALASASPRRARLLSWRIRRCRPAGPSTRGCPILHGSTLPWPVASPAGSSP